MAERAGWVGPIAALLLVLLFIIAGIWIATTVDGYMIVDGGDPNGPSNPAYKTVIADRGAWLYNYAFYKWPAIAPALSCGGGLLTAVLMASRKSGAAVLASSIAVAGIVTTAGFSMYPFLLPSSTHPNDSLTIWDASSSRMTLGLMLAAAIFFLPIILAYTSWVYYVLRGRVSETAIEQGDDYYY